MELSIATEVSRAAIHGIGQQKACHPASCILYQYLTLVIAMLSLYSLVILLVPMQQYLSELRKYIDRVGEEYEFYGTYIKGP